MPQIWKHKMEYDDGGCFDCEQEAKDRRQAKPEPHQAWPSKFPITHPLTFCAECGHVVEHGSSHE